MFSVTQCCELPWYLPLLFTFKLLKTYLHLRNLEIILAYYFYDRIIRRTSGDLWSLSLIIPILLAINFDCKGYCVLIIKNFVQ